MGGYQAQFYASQHPERIEKLFLLDPAGTEALDPAKNVPTNMMHADECWRRYTAKEIEADIKNNSDRTKHFMQGLHDLPGCVAAGIWKDIASWLHADIKAAGYPPEAIKAWDEYYLSTLSRPSFTDNLQMEPMTPPGYLRNSLQASNRFGRPECAFPIAYAFGDQSFLCSEAGAEDILNMMKEKNGG